MEFFRKQLFKISLSITSNFLYCSDFSKDFIKYTNADLFFYDFDNSHDLRGFR